MAEKKTRTIDLGEVGKNLGTTKAERVQPPKAGENVRIVASGKPRSEDEERRAQFQSLLDSVEQRKMGLGPRGSPFAEGEDPEDFRSQLSRMLESSASMRAERNRLIKELTGSMLTVTEADRLMRMSEGSDRIEFDDETLGNVKLRLEEMSNPFYGQSSPEPGLELGFGLPGGQFTTVQPGPPRQVPPIDSPFSEDQ